MGERILYVSKAGSDNWSGNLQEVNTDKTDGPLATIKRARDIIREERDGKEINNSYCVEVRAGKYYFDDTLVLDERDSGTKEFSITYKAFKDEEVIISGGIIVTGWEKYKDNIFKTVLPDAKGGKLKFRQIFSNGICQTRSRWPKNDPDDPRYTGWIFVKDEIKEKRREAFEYHENEVFKKWSKPSEGEVNIFDGGQSWNNIVPIKKIDTKKNTITLTRKVATLDFTPWHFESYYIKKGNRYFIENILEELTLPGEWCFDSEDGILYFWPSDGSIENKEVVIPVLDCLINLENTANISISGFTFTETSGSGDNNFKKGSEGSGVIRVYSELKYCGEVINMKKTKYCTLEENRFYYTGGNAVYLYSDNYRNRIINNEISYSGANGICLFGSGREYHPRFNIVENNDINNVGRILKFSAGVALGLSDGNQVKHNYIHDVPHHAINLGSNGLGRNFIEYNRICNTALENHDTAAINCWGDVPFPNVEGHAAERSGHFIRHNYIANTAGCIANEDGKIVRSDFSFGIYLDDFTSNCYVYGNIINKAGKGTVMHCGKHNVFENNIFINCTDQIWYQNPASGRPGNESLATFGVGNNFNNNIFYFSDPKAIILYFLYRNEEHIDMYSAIGQMDNNVFFHSEGGEYNMQLNIWSEKEGYYHTKNLKVMPYSERIKDGFDINSVFGDPMFLSIENEDFRLKPDSPALKLGFKQIDMEQIGIVK